MLNRHLASTTVAAAVVFVIGSLLAELHGSEADLSPTGPVLSYRLTGPVEEENPWREPTTATSGLDVSRLVRGPGILPANLTNGFSGTWWSNDDDHEPPLPPTRETALAEGDYFELETRVKSGYTASLSSLDVSLRRSGLGAPDQYEWQYSFDGFQTEGETLQQFRYLGRASGSEPDSYPPFSYTYSDLPGQNAGNPMETIDLSGIEELQGLRGGATVTFRLYAWGADRNSRTVAMGRTDGPSLGGKVYATLPPALRWQEASAADGEDFRLSWDTVPAHVYTLWESVDLRDWQPVNGYPLTAEGEVMEYRPSMEPDAAFYHVATAGPAEAQVIEAYFSVAGPTLTEADLTLEEKLIQFLDMAEPGSTVLASVYTWSRTNMAEAFIDAQDRGVEVRIVYGGDGANDGDGYYAETLLREGLPEGHFLTCPDGDAVHGSCHGTGINHNKFFLFSNLSDGSEDVVVQSSANLTNPQIRSFNNMVVVRGDSNLYDAYETYWQDLATNFQDLNYYWTAEVDSGIDAHFFPRREGSGVTGENDTVAEILEELAVELGFSPVTDETSFWLVPEDVPPGGPKAEIHVGMAYWTNLRAGIARRLAALHENGVIVRVTATPDHLGDDVRGILTDAGIPLTLQEGLHSKYMLVDYEVRGRRHRRVYTGSHNFTSPALRSNDEVLLTIRDRAIYEIFLDDWKRIQEHPMLQSGYSD